MAYYGNLALRPERAPEETVKRQSQGQPQKSTHVRRRQLPIGEKLLYLFTIAVVVLVAGFVIYRYAQIYQLNVKIQQSGNQYEKSTAQMKELQREVERLSDPGKIREKALAMGMVPAPRGITVTSKDGKNAVASKP